MNLGKPCRVIGVTAIGVILFLFLTILFIPAVTILRAANSGLSKYGLKLSAKSFNRSLPLGISGSGITLSSESGELLKISKGQLTIEFLPLLLGNLSIALNAEIGSGTLVSSLSLLRAPSARMVIKNVPLEDIPFFQTAAGMKATGFFSGKVETSGQLARAKGYLQIEVRGAEFSSMKLGELSLPDASYNIVQGMIRIKDGKAVIESFTLQGDELYVRLKGGLPLVSPLQATPLDLSLELMPKPALLETQKLIFLLLLKYQDTPGHYLIPVKGALGKPQAL